MAEPWQVERVYSNGCEVCPRIMAGREIVAEVCGAPYLGFAETLRRAHLIAAVPGYHVGVEQMLANEDCGGNGWWEGWEMVKDAHARSLPPEKPEEPEERPHR